MHAHAGRDPCGLANALDHAAISSYNAAIAPLQEGAFRQQACEGRDWYRCIARPFCRGLQQAAVGLSGIRSFAAEMITKSAHRPKPLWKNPSSQQDSGHHRSISSATGSLVFSMCRAPIAAGERDSAGGDE